MARTHPFKTLINWMLEDLQKYFPEARFSHTAATGFHSDYVLFDFYVESCGIKCSFFCYFRLDQNAPYKCAFFIDQSKPLKTVYSESVGGSFSVDELSMGELKDFLQKASDFLSEYLRKKTLEND